MCAVKLALTTIASYTYRSLKSLCVFQAGVPEKLIKQLNEQAIDHWSLLCQYENTSESQPLDASNAQSYSDAFSYKLTEVYCFRYFTYNKGPSPYQMLSVTQSVSLTHQNRNL